MSTYKRIWKIMKNYDLKTETDLPVDCVCIICNGLLKDAFRGQCNCVYCRKCVRNFIEFGERYCPGSNSACKLNNLSFDKSVVKDFDSDDKVLKLQLKCPNDFCSYYSSTVDMVNHVIKCNIKELCPFSDIGCLTFVADKDKLFDHLLIDINRHCKLLTEWIINLTNESTCLLAHNQSHWWKNEFSTLENVLNLKISENSACFEEDRLRNEDCFNNLQQQATDLASKNDILTKLLKEIKEVYQKALWSLTENLAALNIENENKEKRINELKNQLKSESRWISEESHAIYIANAWPNTLMDNRLICTSRKSIASFEWQVVGIYDKKMDYHCISSESFFSVDGDYEMYLTVITNGCFEHIYTHLCIEFHIDCHNDRITEPLKCFISLIIYNPECPTNAVILVKQCQFDHQDWLRNCTIFHVTNDDIDNWQLSDKKSMFIKCLVSKMD